LPFANWHSRPGLHLENIFGRDINQFSQDQGARTKVCYMRSEFEATNGIAEIGYIPKGCGYFHAPLRCGSVAVHQAQLPRCTLRIHENISQRDLKRIFEMGSRMPIIILAEITNLSN